MFLKWIRLYLSWRSVNQAEYRHRLKKYGEVVKYCDGALQLNPQSARAYRQRGLARHDQGLYEQALTDLNQAIALNPKNAAFYCDRATTYAANANWQAALVDFEEAIRLNPKFAETYRRRARMKAEQKDFSGAIEDYDKALQLRPGITDLYNERGIAYGELGNLEEAKDNFDTILRRNSKHVDAYMNRARIWHELGNDEAALADMDKVLQLQSDMGYAYYSDAILRCATLNRRLGRLSAALDNYSEAIRLDPTCFIGYSNRGEIHFLQENYLQALQDFQKACELKSDFPYAIAGLAVTHFQLDQLSEAQSLWRELLAINPQYSDAEWIGKELNWQLPLVEAARKLIQTLSEK